MKCSRMTTEKLPETAPASVPQPSCAFDESFVEARDGARLRVRTARLAGTVRAELLVVHGFGEHAGRYSHVAAALAERGIRVETYDLRGHGRSSGRRGDVADYALLLDDLRAMHERAGASGRPVFLFGHSLGGQIVLRFLAREEPRVAGAVVASPWLRLAFAPPRWKLALAHVALRLIPWHRQSTGMVLDELTRDRAHAEAMPDRELMLHRISARMFFAVQAAGAQALAEAGRLRAPLLLLHGEADPVTCWHATAELHTQAAAADKTLKTFPGALHEMHNDLVRDEVLRALGEWISARC